MKEAANEWSWVRAARRALHYQGGNSWVVSACGSVQLLTPCGGGGGSRDAAPNKEAPSASPPCETYSPPLHCAPRRPATQRSCGLTSLCSLSRRSKHHHTTPTQLQYHDIKDTLHPPIEFTVSKWSYTGFCAEYRIGRSRFNPCISSFYGYFIRF